MSRGKLEGVANISANAGKYKNKKRFYLSLAKRLVKCRTEIECVSGEKFLDFPIANGSQHRRRFLTMEIPKQNSSLIDFGQREV